ncbi:MAG TPA: family 20 glycosylhydrolase [Cellulomonas sp.]
MPELIGVIPRPRVCEPLDGPPFEVTSSTAIVVRPTPEEIALAVVAADLLSNGAGSPVEVRYVDGGGAGVIALRLTPDGGPADDERYTLTVTAARIVIDAPRRTGLVRGLATLRQLLRPVGTGAERRLVAPAVRIEDVPRYRWRGLSVDVARHFFGLAELKVVVSLLARYKLNVLHLHLTDDQGWRLEVPSRPLLTELSAGSAVGGDPGGFLRAAEYAELVEHAAARGVTVVPEIDIPGHVNAALHAYGELSPSGQPADGYTGIEVGFSRLSADLPATAAFLRDVFADVAALTPGGYVHIGGDEVTEMPATEYASLVGTAADAVHAAGKRVVGWQEVASVALAPGSLVQVWDHRLDPTDVIAAVRAGARVLLSPGPHAYLDMKYDASTALGLEWAGHIELRDAYEWEPSTFLAGVPAEAVEGVEAAVWTETIRSLDELTTMLLPRLAAIAEVAWSAPEQRDWSDFRERVAQHGAMWDRTGLAWYASPQVDWAPGLA